MEIDQVRYDGNLKVYGEDRSVYQIRYGSKIKFQLSNDTADTCRFIYDLLELYRGHHSYANAKHSEENLSKVFQLKEKIDNYEFNKKEKLLLPMTELFASGGKCLDKENYMIEFDDSFQEKVDKLYREMRISLSQTGGYTEDLTDVKEALKELGEEDKLERLIEKEAECAAEQMEK